MANVLLTGGCGYIGSHVWTALIEAGDHPVIVDDLSNSDASVLARLQQISGVAPEFIKGDIRDTALLRRVLQEYGVTAVMHFAGLKAVGESTREPVRYFDCNVAGTLSLLQAMQDVGVRTLVFSSSATVYGDPDRVPLAEDAPCRAVNPYGRSKLMIEEILADLHQADPAFRIARLRYFNPIGAHPSGLIGEDPRGIPNNLMPYVAQVAAGVREQLYIYGCDWPTPDGTGVRDYIHVCDLAEGHLAALRYFDTHTGLLTLNLGTGRGVSVLELVHAFEAASGVRIPHAFVERRPGDVAVCYADPTVAARVLGFRTRRDLHTACADVYRRIASGL